MNAAAKHSLADRAARRVVRRLVNLPAPVKRMLAGRPIVVDGQTLDVNTQIGLRLMHLAGTGNFDSIPIEKARAQLSAEAWIFGDELPIGSVEDITIPTAQFDLPARIYRPAGLTGPAGGLVHFHGGGWTLGDLGAADAVSRWLAHHAGIIVISVHYRLAPENPFPAALDDTIGAYAYVATHAEEFGLDPARIGVSGESAGANLAAVIAQTTARAARCEPSPTPVLQVLFQPVTDLSVKRESYRLFGEGFTMTEDHMDLYKRSYLGDNGSATDPRISPLLADDLSGVAPAYISTAGFDVLRDEGEAYARKLEQAGVPVTLVRTPSLAHSAINVPNNCPPAQEALLAAAEAIRSVLGSGVDT
ncbi:MULTISPECIES: alpha/beta hydrolase [unclassified Mycobacterium]|uniref:alpha/beta hydrolase n=1 Tax=unclassified Mycobacterium TaxID=2642494 RepID=UPI0029C84AB3|nr:MULTISPECIES: alpha/beta hydrolase [unclassified Mycobacterium]